MNDATSPSGSPTSSAGSTTPPAIAKVLARFRAMGREEKMQALVHYSKKLEPLPPRYADVDHTPFAVPECQTRVDLFPEHAGGRMHYYADLNVRQSPTIAAVLAILFSAINDQPPRTTLDIPSDFVSELMEGIGLSGREAGLNAMISRLKRFALAAATEEASSPSA